MRVRCIHPLLFLIVIVLLGIFAAHSIVSSGKKQKEDAYLTNVEVYEKLSYKVCLKENKSKCSIDEFGNLNRTPIVVVENISFYISKDLSFIIVERKDSSFFYGFKKSEVHCNKDNSKSSSICLNISNIEANLKYIPEYVISSHSIEFTRKEFEDEVKKHKFLEIIIKAFEICHLENKKEGCALIHRNVSQEFFNIVFEIASAWEGLLPTYGLESIKRVSYYPLEILCCFSNGKLKEVGITFRKNYFVNRRYYSGITVIIPHKASEDEKYFTTIDRILKIKAKVKNHLEPKDLKESKKKFFKSFAMPIFDFENKKIKIIFQNESGRIEIDVTPPSWKKYGNSTRK